MEMDEIIFQATDVKYDCGNCVFNNKKCHSICLIAANLMDCKATKAVGIKQPEIEYQGG